jgi:ketosteroid isomerase-like protein
MKTILVSLLVVLSSLKISQKTHKPTAVDQDRQQQITQPKNTTAMEKQAMEVVSTFLTAIQQGNHDVLASSLHPDVTWSQPGTNRFAGQKTSRTEVFKLVGGMVEASEKSLRLTDVKTLAVNGNQVACLLHWKAIQSNGGILDVDNIDVYTVKNGQIVNATIFSADLAQEDNFWLN